MLTINPRRHVRMGLGLTVILIGLLALSPSALARPVSPTGMFVIGDTSAKTDGTVLFWVRNGGRATASAEEPPRRVQGLRELGEPGDRTVRRDMEDPSGQQFVPAAGAFRDRADDRLNPHHKVGTGHFG